MKAWLKTLRIVAFATILILMLGRAYEILSWKDTMGGYISATQQLYATRDNLIDVLFVGSSHVYTGIDPMILWKSSGIAAFNYAISGQDKESAYYGIKEVLKTQHPKVVFIDAFALTYDTHGIQANIYRNMLAMRYSLNSVALVKSYIEPEEQRDYLLRWPIIHTRYREIEKNDFVQYPQSIFGRGFYLNSAVAEIDPFSEQIMNMSDTDELSEKNKDWLNRIIQLSKEEQFDLVFMLVPCQMNEEQQIIINSATEYLESEDIPFLNLNNQIKSIGIDYKTDFIDTTHISNVGAVKVTSYLQGYLKENCTLENHKEDVQYHLWDECLDYSIHYQKSGILEQQDTLGGLIATATQMDDVVIIISLDGEFYQSNLNIAEILEMFLGIPEDDYYQGGKWVFGNKSLIQYIPNDGEEYVLDLSDTDTLRIKPGVESTTDIDTNIKEQVMINKTNCFHAKDGISVTVYDQILDKIVVSKGYY